MSFSIRLSLFLSLLYFVAACGDLSEEGRTDSDFVPQNIQDIFDNECIACHNAGHDLLDLRESWAYGELVDVASAEIPSLRRVMAGDAAASYLYQKITGAAGIVGERMPASGPVLTVEQETLIAAWIDQGARARAEQPNVFIQTYSFAQHVQPIFQSNCGGCHDGSGSDLPASMNLQGNAYLATVNVPSLEAALFMRIRPYHADSSYVYHKIKATSTVRTGERMPDGGPYLSDATIDTIRTWITEGALNN